MALPLSFFCGFPKTVTHIFDQEYREGAVRGQGCRPKKSNMSVKTYFFGRLPLDSRQQTKREVQKYRNTENRYVEKCRNTELQ